MASDAFVKNVIPPILMEGIIISGISGCGQKDREVVVLDIQGVTNSDHNRQDEEGVYFGQEDGDGTTDESISVNDELPEDGQEANLAEIPSYVVEMEEAEKSVLMFPKTGETITVSLGTDANPQYQQAEVFKRDAWSREYTTDDYTTEKLTGKEGLFWRRLKYAMENYEYNDTDDDLLIFHLSEKYQNVFAGAMVDGYADIGDIVEVSLDNGDSFNFLIIDVKNIEHTKAELAKNNQCQCKWGHGYMLGKTSVQLNPCEFLSTGKCREGSAQNAPSGAFLKGRRVEKAEIVAHIEIGEYTGN